VDYTESGPRIEGWEPIGSTRKKLPPPSPQPEAEAEAPVLGRGAIRRTRIKRKSDEISAAEAPESAPAASPAPEEMAAAAGTAPPSPAKKVKKEASPPAAEESLGPVASESVVGEGKQKRKRRPGKPKISAARVENSSSG
jgi:hypothetical protein